MRGCALGSSDVEGLHAIAHVLTGNMKGDSACVKKILQTCEVWFT